LERESGMTTTRLWGPLSSLGVAIAALAFGLDQSIKWYLLAIVNMPERQQINIAPFFDLVMAWNHGVSYGLLKTPTQLALIAVSLVISLVLWLWVCRSTRPVTVTALGMIIGGALGNSLDRAIHGAVADFFYFHWQDWSWYIFNPADMCIVAGVALLMYESIIEPRKV
jgi:signal peptidase II